MTQYHQEKPPIEAPGGGDLPFSPAVGCLISLLIGVMLVWFIFQIGRLVSDGELRYAENELTAIRVWRVSDVQHEGLALSTNRIIEGGAEEPRACVQTSVRFLLWQNDDAQRGTNYCECYETQEGEWQFVEECSP